jgi:hypothetical protein
MFGRSNLDQIMSYPSDDVVNSIKSITNTHLIHNLIQKTDDCLLCYSSGVKGRSALSNSLCPLMPSFCDTSDGTFDTSLLNRG